MEAANQLALRLTSRKSVPLLLQAENTECGLACLGMIAGYYGYSTDMTTLRARYAITMRGATLTALASIAAQMQLSTRSVRAEMHELDQLELPCILHWNHVHFIVLKAVKKTHIVVNDPALGERKIDMQEVSDSFTGVAMELWPNVSGNWPALLT